MFNDTSVGSVEEVVDVTFVTVIVEEVVDVTLATGLGVNRSITTDASSLGMFSLWFYLFICLS